MIVPEWGDPVRHQAGELPGPITQLLETWRELRGGDVAAELARLKDRGFNVYWRSGPNGSGEPVRR